MVDKLTLHKIGGPIHLYPLFRLQAFAVGQDFNPNPLPALALGS
jgi:hypothetical protein